MKKHFLQLLLLFLVGLFIQSAKAQTEHKLIIQTSMDEPGGFLTPLNGNHFLLMITRGEFEPIPDDVNQFYNYNNITYLVSDELELIDSLHYNTIEGYGTRIAQIHPLPDGNYLAVGNAYDSVSNDFQLYLRWFDAGLELVRDSLIGSPSLRERYHAAFVNLAGNIVLAGGYDDTDSTVADHRFFIEMSPDGNLIQQFTETSSIIRFGLVQLGGDGKYYQSGYPNKFIRLNTDFTLDSIIDFDGEVEIEIRDFGVLNDTTFYYAGNYFKQGSPPPIDNLEMAFQPVSWRGEIMPLHHFGAVDTLDFYNSMNVNGDCLFIAGTINSVIGPVPSWYMANKLNHQLELEYQVVYGDGVRKYRSAGTMPTADGGFVAVMSVWDYHHYPGDMIQHDVVVVRFDANGQLVGRLELPAQQLQSLKLAPNPASDFVQIVDEQHCWKTAQVYDQQGRLIAALSVSDCNYFQTAKLKPGNYLIRLLDQHDRQAFARLIKQ